MGKIESAPRSADNQVFTGVIDIDPVAAAEIILRKFGPRAVSVLTASRPLTDGRTVPARLSANDCYVALDEACRKMARVAVRRYRQAATGSAALAFAECVGELFPDPVAYLARSIKSVVSDSARAVRRELPTLSLEQPLAADDGDGALHLGDTLREDRTWKLPEEALEAEDDRARFRNALAVGLRSIPANYLEALKRDIARDQERQAGNRVSPETDRERQTVCRARAALSQIIKRECGDDNPFVRLLAQQRSSRVRQKAHSSGWSGDRQEALFRKLMQSGWSERAAVLPDDSVDEAVVNDVSHASPVAPPSPELRQTMRVLDLYTVDFPTPQTPDATALYLQAREMRQAGKIEAALQLFKACYDAEPTFVEALNNVGNMHSQLGNLRDALKIFLDIVEHHAGEHRNIAATNAADIYLTWYDAGRNKERNIERAIYYARLAMQRPTPMRACNLLLAYAKDRYYDDAKQVLQAVLQSNTADCPAERFLQTLFQIRDPDLVRWWGWLEGEL